MSGGRDDAMFASLHVAAGVERCASQSYTQRWLCRSVRVHACKAANDADHAQHSKIAHLQSSMPSQSQRKQRNTKHHQPYRPVILLHSTFGNNNRTVSFVYKSK